MARYPLGRDLAHSLLKGYAKRMLHPAKHPLEAQKDRAPHEAQTTIVQAPWQQQCHKTLVMSTTAKEVVNSLLCPLVEEAQIRRTP